MERHEGYAEHESADNRIAHSKDPEISIQKGLPQDFLAEKGRANNCSAWIVHGNYKKKKHRKKEAVFLLVRGTKTATHATCGTENTTQRYICNNGNRCKGNIQQDKPHEGIWRNSKSQVKSSSSEKSVAESKIKTVGGYMKKEVEVCDICTNSFAKVRCDMCGNMICLDCGIKFREIRCLMYFKGSPSSDNFIFLSRIYLTKDWLANESIKNFIVCKKCETEIADAMDGFVELPREQQRALEEELIRIMKEKMEALILANKL